MFNQKDEAFYTRRYHEELRRADAVEDETLRALHARWAELYRMRLAALLRRR